MNRKVFFNPDPGGGGGTGEPSSPPSPPPPRTPLPPTTAELKALIDQAVEGNAASQKEIRRLSEENEGLRKRLEVLADAAPLPPSKPKPDESAPKSILWWWPNDKRGRGA